MPDAAISNTTSNALRQAYAQARQHLGQGQSLLVLHLGEQESGLAWGAAAQAEQQEVLPLGLQSTAGTHFRTAPPTPMALEHAIMVVEDVVMPLAKRIAGDSQLFSADAALRDLARLSGVPNQAVMELPLQALEHSFNRLADVVSGRPAETEGLPQDLRFATALLILREFMHHLQFAHITLLEPQAA